MGHVIRTPSLSWLLLASVKVAAVIGEIIPAGLEADILEPQRPVHLTIGVGAAKFLRYRCLGGPADVGITLSTYSERADPLLFLSLTPDELPTFQRHDASSFGQWRQDSDGDHYVIARSVSPRGGILGLVNMRRNAQEILDGILRIRCSYIIAFDALFWDHLKSDSICPVGGHFEDGAGWTQLLGRPGLQASPLYTLRATGMKCSNSIWNGLSSTIVVRNVEECGHRCAATVGCVGFGYATSNICQGVVRGMCELWKGPCDSKPAECWDDYSMTPTSLSSATKDIGPEPSFCSGHGGCGREGICVCDGNWTGPACEHKRVDLSVMAEGHYSFKVLSGRYQYFRVRVPPNFPGGTLNVAVSSEVPLILLVRGDGLPTKDKFDTSNFDDWLVGSNNTHVIYGVDGHSPSDMGSLVMPRARGLMQRAYQSMQCPKSAPWISRSQCKTEAFKQCESSCRRCMHCVKTKEDANCNMACKSCVSNQCRDMFALCAGDIDCQSEGAMQCSDGCSGCLSCFDSNDGNCAQCDCCMPCLPPAAKCSQGGSVRDAARYVYIGIFHHRRYHGGLAEARASVSISLTEDPQYQLHEKMPSSFIEDLYDKFQDITDIDSFNDLYPKQHQFIFELNLTTRSAVAQEVEIYRSRMTLLHIRNMALLADMVLHFNQGPIIRYVLASRRASPKTLFDFDRMLYNHEAMPYQLGGGGAQAMKQLRIDADGEPSIWIAIFGAADGYIEVAARAYGEEVGGYSTVQHLTTMLLVILLGFLCVFGIIQHSRLPRGTLSSIRPTVDLDPSACGEAGTCLGEGQNAAEDRFLKRGGIGDDGI